MKVKIDLRDATSIDKALNELEKFQERLLKFATDLVNELADEGADIAGVKFSEAVYAGINDAQPGRTAVRFSTWKRKASVYVNGNAVLFIEFGTGITKAEAPEEEAEIVRGRVMSHGAYGLRKAENPNGWYYTGSTGMNQPDDTYQVDNRRGSVHTKGNDANSSMYHARLELEQKYTEIAQRVYERSFGR